MHVYMYKHIHMYVYINTFYSYSTFSHGAIVSIPCTWYMAVPKKKKKKKKTIYWSGYLSFFSLKLAFDVMIFYCRLGQARDKGSSFEFIFKFSSFSLVFNFFSCLKRVHTLVICVCCSSSKGSFSGSESVVSEYR